MDYSLTAKELLKKMSVLVRSSSHKKFGEFVEGEMFVLNHLSFVKDKMLPSELASVMNISTSRIAAILNSLERKGWITREIDETDRRRILVSLTSCGKQFVLKKHQTMHDMTEFVLRQLGEDDTRDTLRLLDRFIGIYQNMTQAENPCIQKNDAIPKDDILKDKSDILNEKSKGETQS